MGTKLPTINFAFYRWRYNLGYLAIGTLLIALLVTSIFIPGTISEGEMQATAQSTAVSLKHFTPDMVINLPYYLLQKTSFSLFGIHVFSIKLPSLILAFLSSIGALLLLEKWFKRNTAILTALLAVTTGPFLLIAQSGTPAILYIFWPILILLSGSMLSHKAGWALMWKLLLFTSVALSLYTPLGIYILVAIVIASIFHPHIRYTLWSLPRVKIAIALVVAACLLAPVVYSITQQGSVGLRLLGIPSSLNLSENIQTFANYYFSFTRPNNDLVMTPVYELATILLMMLGIYRIATTKYTARSYILASWLIMLFIVMLLSPKLIAITFIPGLLLIGFGIDHLIRSWYQLFPRNPYARVAGLIPLVIFIASLTLSGVDRYMYGNLYDPPTTSASSSDLSLLQAERRRDKQPAILLVSKDEQAFYQALKRQNTSWHITSVVTSPIALDDDTLLVTTNAAGKPNALPAQILTNGRANASDRFYIYKNDHK